MQRGERPLTHLKHFACAFDMKVSHAPSSRGRRQRRKQMQIGRMGAGFSGLLAVAAVLAVETPAPPKGAPPPRVASAEEIDQAVTFAHAQADLVAGKKAR